MDLLMKKSLAKILNKEDLTSENTHDIINGILNGQATDAQIGAFLTAMSCKGETIEEITACAVAMHNKCLRINNSEDERIDVLDIVGTGGDNLATFNISTVSSIITAASGIAVAKHGSRSVSSKCGSADLLEALGVNITLSPKQCESVLKKTGFCFMLSQTFYSAMKSVNIVRKQLGFRTIFNIVGPLVNPAGATYQLLGVYDERFVEPLANVLSNIGVKRGMVVHGHDGLDEISVCSSTTVCEISNGKLNSFFISPEQFGLKRYDMSELKGGMPAENAELALHVLKGKKGAMRDSVVLNSAFCIYMSNNSVTLKECVRIAQELIDSGKALEKLNELISETNKFTDEVQ